MSDLVSEIVINLSGNLTERARKYSGAMKKFSESNSAMARGVRGSMKIASRGFDKMENRYTALVATVAGGAMANRLVDLDRRLSRFSVAADLTKDKTRELYAEIENVSQDTNIRIDPAETLGGIEVIMEKIGDLDFALANKRNIAIVAQATGASGESVGAVLTQLKTLSIETQKEVLEAMDTLNVQGKSGSFTLAAFAANGERILAAYAATGRKGITATREVGAALQVIRKGVGSDDQAVTAYERLMSELTDPKRVEALKKFAKVDVFDQEKLKNGVEVMRPLPLLMQEVSEAAGGFSENWKLLGFGEEAKRAFTSLNAELKATGEIHGFDNFVNVKVDGSTTINDASKVASDYQASIQTVSTAVQKLSNRELGKPMQELSDAINSLDSAAIDRWLQIGKNIAYTVGGLIAARKALSVAKDLKQVFGKKSGGKGNAALGGYGLGVQQVYVVNMGAGGLGGLSPTGNKTKNPKGLLQKSGNLANAAGKLLVPLAVSYELSGAMVDFMPDSVKELDKKWTNAFLAKFGNKGSQQWMQENFPEEHDNPHKKIPFSATQGYLNQTDSNPYSYWGAGAAPEPAKIDVNVKVSEDKKPQVSVAISGLPGQSMGG